MEFLPITLKQLVIDCDISQKVLRDLMIAEMGVEVSRPSINLCLNRGYIPTTMPKFSQSMELIIGRHAAAVEWLSRRGLRVGDIWAPIGHELRNVKPIGPGKRIGRGHAKSLAEMRGRNNQANENDEVAMINEMVNTAALKHFKLFRSPFINDVQRDSDIFMSDEHRYIEAAMLDAANHGGFLAVIGEVGSGKSVMRRKVVEALKKSGDTQVIYPMMHDKEKLTAASICDAIIQDISTEKCRIKLEDKARQVQRLLANRAKSGHGACLIIEEAHDLKTPTLKYLKRFYELEDGYKKLLGIIMIGQTELKYRFNEAQNWEMREVIRRVQVAEIRGLEGNIQQYLEVKFKRVGLKQIEDVFEKDAFEALNRRLTMTARDGVGKISMAYPQTVNNWTARALNIAFEMGEAKVTAEVIEAM
jgi:type II secretory pathway predicted ATPase ExeA